MTDTKLHRPRAKHKVTLDSLNNMLLIIGGIDGNMNNDSPLKWVEKFDISKKSIIDK